MSSTLVRKSQIRPLNIVRSDINTTTSGSALITKIIAGTGLTLSSSTGVNPGTGDVTVALSIATASTLGGVKIGSGLSVAVDGTISVNSVSTTWGSITGLLSNQTDLQAALNAKYNIPTGTSSQYIDGTGALQTFPSALATGYVRHEVKAGVPIIKGQAVYVRSSDGTNMIVELASYDTEQTSSKTMGLLDRTVSTNGFANVITEGLLAGLDTTAAQAGDPVWLGPNGNLLYGIANKPYAPFHMVFIGIVTRVNANNGEIFVKVQNGYELNEIHDVLISGAAAGQLLRRDSDGLWKNWTPNYLTSFTETDPTVPAHVKAITTTNISNWNTAYSWGNHATQGYLTSVTNISGYAGTLLREDNRTISPSELAAGQMKFGFTSWNNNNTSPYADFIHMRSYTDASGGTDNLIMFLKNGIGMRIWQQSWGSTNAYAEYVDVWTTGNFTQTNVNNWNTAYSWGNHGSQGYATQSYVNTAISNLVDAAPGALDTLNELAAALGDDPNFATTVTNNIATKVSKSGDTMTGNLNWAQTDRGITWGFNTDGAYIKFFNTGDGDPDSRLEYATSDNGDEYHRWMISGSEEMTLKFDGLRVRDSIWMGGNLVATQSWVGSQGYITGYTESDPTVPAHVKAITTTNISNWNTAYGWGNHASVGYLTSYTETDTLATVTARGASTNTSISVNGVRLGRNFSIADRGTVRIDSNGTSYPSDILFGHTPSANQSSWDGVYWSISSRAAENGNRFTIWRGGANASIPSESRLFTLEPSGDLNLGADSSTSQAFRLGGDNASGGRLYFQYAGDSSYIDSYGGHGGTQRYRDLQIVARNLNLNSSGGVVNINGSLALNASNYSSYALPLSGGNVTGRVEFQYAGDRYSQAWRNNTTGAYWWVTTDSDKLGFHRNGDADKFYFSNGGDFWSSTNGWLSSALSAKQNASTAINTSNIGSQSVNYANSAGSASNLQGYSAYDLVTESRGMHSGSDFPNGTLVRTDIDANGWAGNSFVMEVSGKSYSSSDSPFKLVMQGYLYADTIINVSAMSYGSYFPSGLMVFRLDGKLCFWWRRGSYWNSFEVHVRSADGDSWNRVTSISDSADPGGDKRVGCTPIQVIHSNNIGSQSVNYANSAGSVAWSNVSGRPTTVSSFTNDSGYITSAALSSYVPTSRTITINGVSYDLSANRSWTVSGSDSTKLPLAGGTMSGTVVLHSISGVEQTVPNNYGAYLHLGAWGVDRTDARAVLVNTAYRADYADSLFDMNISRFTNNSGYVTSSGSVAYASSSGNADTVDGKHATNNAGNIAVYESNGYLYIPSWLNVNGGGVFSGTNNAHLRPNTGSYGAWEMIGSKNGWSGIYFNDSGDYLMANNNEVGHYQNGVGWKFRWYSGEMYISSGSTGGGSERTVIHSGNIGSQSVSYASSAGTATNAYKLLASSNKSHYLGESSSWDGVGFGSLTNLHFQGHNQFWVGAGNAYWWSGGIATEHDLLISTMQGYDNSGYFRGITFAVDVNGNGSSGGYRLGRWQTHNNDWKTARLQVDSSLSVGYGNRTNRAYNEAKYPLDRGVWAHGRDQAGYGSDRIRDYLFSPTSNGGGPWGSFASLEVSSPFDGNSDIPALFRMHQWGSGSVEFWKPQGRTLFVRESPGGGGSWFDTFNVQGRIDGTSIYDNGSRVAISRGEGRDYVNYSRYVYNNGAYSGSGWVEPSDLGVRYAASANYATSAGSAGSASYARYLPTYYVGGQQTNPQVYFNNGIGLNVAMTGSWSVWSDTLWINGYSGGDVPWMCALHFLRNSEPRMAISAQRFDSSGYGEYYEVITRYNIGSQSVSNADTVDGYHMNQAVTVNASPTFQEVYANGWLRTTGHQGHYNPTNSAHFYPNDNSYGAWKITGSRNGWGGINLQDPSGFNHYYMHESGNGGYLSHDRWAWYYSRGNDSLGLGGSGTSGSYKVYVNGSLYATGDVVAYSDRRKKTDIVTVEDALEKVKSMRGVFYTKIDEVEKGRQVGVIAQEMNEVLPEAVTYASDVDEYGVKYGNIVGVLIEAIKEQQKEIEMLKSKLN